MQLLGPTIYIYIYININVYIYKYIMYVWWFGLQDYTNHMNQINGYHNSPVLHFFTCESLLNQTVAQIWSQTVNTAASWKQLYMIRSSSHEPQQPMAILIKTRICITQAMQGKMAATVPPVFCASSRWWSQHACTVAAIHPRPHPDAKVQRTQCTSDYMSQMKHT